MKNGRKGSDPERLRDEIYRASSTAIADLLKIRDMVTGGVPKFKLTKKQLEELISISLGTSAEQRSKDTKNTVNTVNNRRARTVKAIGAKTLSHAVWLGIVAGEIPIELREADKKPLEVPAKPLEVIFHIAQGGRDKDIAEMMRLSEEEINDYFLEARDLLGGINRPHTVRRACEERLIPGSVPETAPGQLNVLAGINESVGMAESLLGGAVDLARHTTP